MAIRAPDGAKNQLGFYWTTFTDFVYIRTERISKAILVESIRQALSPFYDDLFCKTELIMHGRVEVTLCTM